MNVAECFGEILEHGYVLLPLDEQYLIKHLDMYLHSVGLPFDTTIINHKYCYYNRTFFMSKNIFIFKEKAVDYIKKQEKVKNRVKLLEDLGT